MKKLLYCSGLLTMITGFISCNNNATKDSTKIADSANTTKVDSAKTADTVATASSHMADMQPDAEFAVAAADGGMLEVALGKMALQKGVSKQIKALGAMMVKDHSLANEELMATAKKKNITLPAMMSDKCQKEMNDLSAKNGAGFDKAYADLMVSDHKDDIAEFNKEAEKGNDKQLSAWAKEKVPTLQHHLMMAEDAKRMTDKK